jgi:microcystin-dependent protein
MSYPIGSIIARARNSANSSADPIWASAFLLCDGANYSQSAYPDLYASFLSNNITVSVNGYGIIDSSSFQVPNIVDRTPCMDTSATLGLTSGAQTQTIEKILLPIHSHGYNLTSATHYHQFIYKGFYQGFNNSLITIHNYQTQNCVIFNQTPFTLPTSLDTVSVTVVAPPIISFSGITPDPTDQAQLDITNSYVGIDYYIKY